VLSNDAATVAAGERNVTFLNKTFISFNHGMIDWKRMVRY
jgi:hypothetical protein